MNIRKLREPLIDKAEGDCCGFPYTTELASSAGVSIHFWTGNDAYPEPELIEKALVQAMRARDIVYATWSTGSPTSYWAHNDIT